jgi:hypothetical protein
MSATSGDDGDENTPPTGPGSQLLSLGIPLKTLASLLPIWKEVP